MTTHIVGLNQIVTVTPVFENGLGVIRPIVNDVALDDISVISGERQDFSYFFRAGAARQSVQLNLIVSNNGEEVSESFTLQPLPEPTIISWTASSYHVFIGDTISLTPVFVNGNAFINNIPLAGFSLSQTITDTDTAFALEIRNAFENVRSVLQVEAISGVPVITQQPTNPAPGVVGSIVELSVIATGPSLIYEWFTDGSFGAFSNNLSTASVTFGSTVQIFYAEIHNQYGQTTSQLVTVPAGIQSHYIPPPTWLQYEYLGTFHQRSLLETAWSARYSDPDPNSIIDYAGAWDIECGPDGTLYFAQWRWPLIGYVNKDTGVIVHLTDLGIPNQAATQRITYYDNSLIAIGFTPGSAQASFSFYQINLSNGSFVELLQWANPDFWDDSWHNAFRGEKLVSAGGGLFVFSTLQNIYIYDLNLNQVSPLFTGRGNDIYGLSVVGSDLYISYNSGSTEFGLGKVANFLDEGAAEVQIAVPNNGWVNYSDAITTNGSVLYISATDSVYSINLDGSDFKPVSPLNYNSAYGSEASGQLSIKYNSSHALALNPVNGDLFVAQEYYPVMRLHYGIPEDVFHITLEIQKGQSYDAPTIRNMNTDWVLDSTCQYSKYNPLCRAKRFSFNGIKPDEYGSALEYYFEAWHVTTESYILNNQLVMRLEDSSGNLIHEQSAWPGSNYGPWFEIYLPYTGLYYMEVSTLDPIEALTPYDLDYAFTLNIQSWDNGTLSGAWAPRFEIQPQNIYSLIGSTVILNAVANGTFELQYQWFKNDVPISGASSPNLTVVVENYTDYFTLTVTNDGGVITSNQVSILEALT